MRSCSVGRKNFRVCIASLLPWQLWRAFPMVLTPSGAGFVQPLSGTGAVQEVFAEYLKSTTADFARNGNRGGRI